LNKIDAKAPHHTEMHVISLIDNATFFKPIRLELLLKRGSRIGQAEFAGAALWQVCARQRCQHCYRCQRRSRQFYKTSPRLRH
jgi:hypothetical protein